MSTQTNKPTAAYGITILLAAILYILFVANLPLPSDPGPGGRFVAGLFSAMVAAFIFFFAHAVVRFTLKAIVEILAGVWLLVNGCLAAGVALLLTPATEYVRSTGVAKDGSLFVVVIGVLLALFVLDLFVMFFLYQAAQVAGTRLDPD